MPVVVSSSGLPGTAVAVPGSPSRRNALISFFLCVIALSVWSAPALAAGPPIITGTAFSAVTATSATLEATLNPDGAKTTPYHFEYVDQASFEASGFAAAETTPDGPALNGSTDTPLSATIEGLAPATTYRFRLFAHNPKGDSEGPEASFATFALSPVFGPCPNDAFRSGELAPPGDPSAALPDCRAYEQVSPVDKNGGDATATVSYAKASSLGNGAIFASSASIPGGEGAQELPTYQGLRGPLGWTSFGQLPPASSGEAGLVIGWLPDFSKTFLEAQRLGDVNFAALLQRSPDGLPPTRLTPYVEGAHFSFAGAGADGTKIAFQASGQLPPEEGEAPIALAAADASNAYVYDEETGRVSLAGVLNTPAETEAALPRGTFAGPYNWGAGSSALALSNGGNSYTQDMRAVSADGSLYFTAAGSGRLYQRVNPTRPQSALDGDGNCSEPDNACTYQLSASRRTPPDPAGSAPAAFQAAAADGSLAYFTSPEKLTPDANTGPDQPEAKIGRSGLDGETEFEPAWLAHRRAVGLAVDDNYIYWASPVDGTIGRAEIGGGNPEPEFIKPGPTTVEVETEPGSEVFETLEFAGRPRYVAVEGTRLCWTNTADGKDNHGTVGCADLDGEGNPVNEDPECVTGASNPQGIALNAEHIYWANSGSGVAHSIGSSKIDCDQAIQSFQPLGAAFPPFGLAVSGTHLYWTTVDDGGNSYLRRAPLDGGTVEQYFLNQTAKLRGLALQGEDLYWAAQGEKAIGHAVWPDAETKPTGVEAEFVKLAGAPSGVAVDGEHLYWSTDGETKPNLGNDLYRFRRDGATGCAQPEGCLDDLAPVPGGNGAEVQGVIGASADGSRLYFVANADLDDTGPAEPGDCSGPVLQAKGHCSLYLWHLGTVTFIARLNASGGNSVFGDKSDWAPSPVVADDSSSTSQKSGFVTGDGTLLFRSREKLTGYDNHEAEEFYLYREGRPLVCTTCMPTGGPPVGRPRLGGVTFPALEPAGAAAVQSRNLSADGDRFFFQTTAAMVASDTDAAGGCPQVYSSLEGYRACLDVYEWEAPGAGSCTEGGPGYSPADNGCLYLLTPGDSAKPSLLADASASGDDVFLFTPEALVGQDGDELFDLYDVRAGGGLAAQNPLPSPPPCEAEGCKPGPTPPPQQSGPSTPAFQGPANPAPRKPGRRHHRKKHKHRHHKRHQGKGSGHSVHRPTGRTR